MGKIVGAFGTGHILLNRGSAGERGDRAFEGMREVGRRVRALKPTGIVLITTDHLYNFGLGLQVPFVVGVADEYVPKGDMGIPRKPFKGHRALGEAFVREGARQGFDLAKAEELEPDHGTALPNLFVNPKGDVPVTPVFVNTLMDPLPTPARCRNLGPVLRGAIERGLPESDRICVLGTGGLSHWLGLPRQGEVNTAFDERVLNAFTSGLSGELALMSTREIEAQAGNGGLEILCWLMMAGSVPEWTGERIYYEAIPEWFTGLGGVQLRAGERDGK
jgi:aromatic ring-opening dioxygenase catalytic subunit (LigB family)